MKQQLLTHHIKFQKTLETKTIKLVFIQQSFQISFNNSRTDTFCGATSVKANEEVLKNIAPVTGVKKYISHQVQDMIRAIKAA